jgi:hypothetical protein
MAAHANQKHGVPLTSADKRHRIKIALKNPNISKWSSRRIAEACCVSHTTVLEARPKESELEESSTSTVVGKDGKAHPAKKPRKKKPGSKGKTPPSSNGYHTPEPDPTPIEESQAIPIVPAGFSANSCEPR